MVNKLNAAELFTLKFYVMCTSPQFLKAYTHIFKKCYLALPPSAPRGNLFQVFLVFLSIFKSTVFNVITFLNVIFIVLNTVFFGFTNLKTDR